MLKIGVVSPNNQLIKSLQRHKIITDRHDIEFFFYGGGETIPLGFPTNHCESFESLLTRSEIVLFGDVAEVEQVFLAIKSFKQVLISDLSIFDKGSIQKLMDISKEAGVFVHYLATGWNQRCFSKLATQRDVIKYMEWSNFKERNLILDHGNITSWILGDLILITSALRKKLKEISLETFNLHTREIDLIRLKLVFTNDLTFYGKWSNITGFNNSGLQVSINGHCVATNDEKANSELKYVLDTNRNLELNRESLSLNEKDLLSFIQRLNSNNLQTINLEDCLQALVIHEELKRKILNVNYTVSN